MRILVCGAGAIGGFFGGHLIKAGADVSFLVRAKRQKNLKKFGLRVLSAQGDFKVIPKFFNKEIESKTFDLIILTNKSYDLDATIRDIKPHAKNAVILPTLNGIAHFFKLDEAFGKKNVFGGAAYISATLNEDGSIQHFRQKAALKFGSRTKINVKVAQNFLDLCQLANFNCELSEDIELDLWRKYVLIGTTAASTVLFQKSLGDISTTIYGKSILLEIHRECKLVAMSAGYDIGSKAEAYNEKLITEKGSILKASMLRDFEKGKQTEAEHILGYLIKLGGEKGIDCILLKAAHTRIQVGF